MTDTNTPAEEPIPAPADEPPRDELWSLLDWTFWGSGMGDVFREPLADTMSAAITEEQRATALQLIEQWHASGRQPLGRRRYEELSAELAEARAHVAAYENAPALRFCLVPTCLRQFDIASWMDSRRTLQRPEWSGKGWKQVRAPIPLGSGHVCPDHAWLVTAHMPRRSEPSYPGRVGIVCTCGGWLTEWHHWHGAARGLWEQHLLTVGGLLPDLAEQPRETCERHPDAPRIDGRCAACTVHPDTEGGEQP